MSVSTSNMFMVCVKGEYQWRRKVPKGGGGGGTQIRNLCTFGKEPI